MKVLRIKLRQNQAHYGRPEGVDNHMTYPLPPYSTVIGALHNACGYTTYHPMEIGIQGRYQSMQKEVVMAQSLNNRREDDRGHLIYLQNPEILTAGYLPVAKAIKNQGNSFKNNVTIDILDRRRMNEYWDLLKKGEELQEYNNSVLKSKKEDFKEKEKEIKDKLKQMDKKSSEHKKLSEEIKKEKEVLKSLEQEFKRRKFVEYERPMSHYKTLIKGPKFTEVLYGVELVLHIKSDENTLKDIQDSIRSLTSIGRSEDFVDVTCSKMVDLRDTVDKEYGSQGYGGYIKRELLERESVLLDNKRDRVNKIPVRGTTFYLPKNYVISENKRSFEYYSVCYISNYKIDEESEGIFIDSDDMIVDLI